MKLKHILLIIEAVIMIVFGVLAIKFFGVNDYTHCAGVVIAFFISFTVFVITLCVGVKDDTNFLSGDGMS
jgi:uncharacterized membrane protein YhaH (DUF805 family)